MGEQPEIYRSLGLLQAEVDLVVDCVRIADELVGELKSGSIRANVVADLVHKYMGSRLRIHAFFKENPTKDE